MDYIINNIKGGKNSIIDKNSGGFLKQKAKLVEGENEMVLLKCKDSEPISYEWMFMILKANTRNKREYQLAESCVN